MKIRQLTDDVRRPSVDRRVFLKRGVSAALLGVTAQSGFWLALDRRLDAQTKKTSDAALQELVAGNQRFAANRLTAIQQDLSVRRSHTIEKQEPFAAVLACADSRVPVELVLDQSIGQIFVCRIAGNIVTPEIIASLEYGVAVLAIRALLVLGHTDCGAIKAAMKGESEPGQISSLYQHLRPAVERSGGDLNRAIQANAEGQAELLRTSSTVIREAVTAGTLDVVAGVYDLASGKVGLQLNRKDCIAAPGQQERCRAL